MQKQMCRKMKFTSRKGILFKLIVYGFSLFLLIVFYFDFFLPNEDPETLWVTLPVFLVVGLLFWIYIGTSYELTEKELKYKSGPFWGKIEIASIREVVKNKTSWGGLKPATARKGLIIKYNKYDEIYISPKTNATFVQKLLKLKPNIKISK